MNNKLIFGFLVTTAFLYVNHIRHIEGIPHPLKTVDAKGVFLPKGQQILEADCDPNFCRNGNMNNGAWPNPDDCSLYYECWGNVTWCQKCSGDTYCFDTKYSGCNYPKMTDCGTRARSDGLANPTPATTVSPQPTSDFDCGQCTNSNGNGTCQEFYPNPNNCSQFIHCTTEKQAYVQNCPADLCYNQTANSCDYCYDVDCDSNSSSNITCSPGYNK